MLSWLLTGDWIFVSFVVIIDYLLDRAHPIFFGSLFILHWIWSHWDFLSRTDIFPWVKRWVPDPI